MFCVGHLSDMNRHCFVIAVIVRGWRQTWHTQTLTCLNILDNVGQSSWNILRSFYVGTFFGQILAILNERWIRRRLRKVLLLFFHKAWLFSEFNLIITTKFQVDSLQVNIVTDREFIWQLRFINHRRVALVQPSFFQVLRNQVNNVSANKKIVLAFNSELKIVLSSTFGARKCFFDHAVEGNKKKSFQCFNVRFNYFFQILLSSFVPSLSRIDTIKCSRYLPWLVIWEY